MGLFLLALSLTLLRYREQTFNFEAIFAVEPSVVLVPLNFSKCLVAQLKWKFLINALSDKLIFIYTSEEI